MRGFQVFAAGDSQHAVALLAEHGPSVKLLAGGTDLLVELKTASEAWDAVIDISRAKDLRAIRLTDDGLGIGAMVTHSEIMRSPLIREFAPALIEAAHSIGAVQTRNLGTLGGNLMTCVPSMDGGPALLALDAMVAVAGPEGSRRMTLAELFVGPRKTCLGPAEVLTEIVIPRRNLGKPAAFIKLGLRKGQALALVNVAAGFRADGGTFGEPAIALGAVAPTVMRATRTENWLADRPISEDAMAEAGRIAATEARPIDDFRARAGYRRDLVAVLVRRALRRAHARATSGPGAAAP